MTSAQRPGATPGVTPSSPTPGAAPIPGSSPGMADVTAVDGTTEVLPSVVQKIVAFAAREIPGVVALGGTGTARAVNAMRQAVTGSGDAGAGVRVDLEDQRAHIGMDIEIEYGAGARELVRALRRHIPKAVEEIAGVPVVELNIVVTDVHLPGIDAEPGV
jgi:uncharacterized alkaline shock family protein YloU